MLKVRNVLHQGKQHSVEYMIDHSIVKVVDTVQKHMDRLNNMLLCEYVDN